MTEQPHHADPIALLQRRRRLTTLASAMFSIGAATWALWPHPSAHQGESEVHVALARASSDASSQSALPPLEMEVFRAARLWNPPPQPVQPAVEEVAAVVSRPNLDLIGIIDEHGQYLAALYDGETKKMMIVGSGDRIEPYLVTSITADGVRLEHGRYVTLLAVREEESPR